MHRGHADEWQQDQRRSRRCRRGMRTGEDSRPSFQPCGTQGHTPDGAGWHSPSARQGHRRAFDRRSEAVIDCSCRVESDSFRVRGDCRDRGLDSSDLMPMQLTITLCGRLRMNLSIGPRFRSDVHWRYCGDGNMPRCSTISKYVRFGLRTTLK